MKRAFSFETDTYYHIYNRGWNKQQLFFDPRDYERFYNNIPRYKEKFPHIQIPAWCFLPNHFHFLIIEKTETGLETAKDRSLESTISEFMRFVQVSYAAFFNAKYGEKIKQGLKSPVFEGRFQAKVIEDDDYLSQLKQYIEWNAVKHELVKKPEEWEYSSYQERPVSNRDRSWENKDDFDPFFE